MSQKSSISRRDFLNGAALSLAAGTALSPAEILAATGDARHPGYPPSLTGMRGSHDGSFEVAHALAREGKTFAAPRMQTDAIYDLVVVGGGISGLSAAKFFRDRAPGSPRILILDNHDDFGGHARRNELDVDGKTLLCYGGSQNLESPSYYSPVAKQVLKDLKIDPQRFYDYYDGDFSKRHGLAASIYFDEATFGKSTLLKSPLPMFRNAEMDPDEMAAAIRALPISETDQIALGRLLVGGVDYLQGRSRREKIHLLRNMSYLDFLKDYADMPDGVLRLLQDTYLPIISIGWEAGSAMEAVWGYMPGTWELGVMDDDEGEPYIFHFPDGNASIARALVRDLIPGVIPGSTMEDLVTARADYGKLDPDDGDIRLRLSSTVVNATHTENKKAVDVVYVNDGQSYRVRAKHVVMACYNNIIPYVCPEMPAQQVEAIQYATKIPFALSSIALRNWRALADAGTDWIYSPGDELFKYLFMDFPISMGGIEYSKNPDEPIVLSGWYSPTTRGLPAKAQYRAGRAKLLQMTFDDFEQGTFSHLDRMLGPYGFDAERDVAALTINRWPHGYAYEFEGIGVPADYDRSNGPHVTGRARMGRISIANSDSEAYAYVDGAIDAADRAVNEQLG